MDVFKRPAVVSRQGVYQVAGHLKAERIFKMKQEFCIDIELDRPHSDQKVSDEIVKAFIESAIEVFGFKYEGSALNQTTAIITYIRDTAGVEEEQIEGLGEEEIEGT